MEISWNDFEKIEMRIGTILKVKDFPEARNASYQLHIDFGAVIGVKKTSAQITDLVYQTSFIRKTDCRGRKFPKQTNRPYDERVFSVRRGLWQRGNATTS